MTFNIIILKMKFPRLKRYFDAYKQGVKERLDKNYALNKSVGW